MRFVNRSINRIRSLFNAIPFVIIVAIGIVLIIVFSQKEVLPAIAFNDFPLNKTQIVEFPTNAASFKQLTDREKKDQLRDWLVFTIASDRDFTPDRINQTLYDLPPVRYGYNKPLANFEYGETRHINLDNNTVVVLVPKTTNQEKRIEDIAYIADAYRKDVGIVPEKIQVFEYELNLDNKTNLNSAKLTRITDLTDREVFSEKYGYYETKIASLKDLESFTEQVNDLTYVHRQDNNLELGGRKITGRNTLSMTVEDVAALWQSYQKVEASGFSLDPNYDYKGLAKELEKSQSFLTSLKSNGRSVFTKTDIQKARLSLSKQDVIIYLSLVDRLAKARIDLDRIKGLVYQKKKEIDSSINQYEKQLIREIDLELKLAVKSSKSREEFDSIKSEIFLTKEKQRELFIAKIKNDKFKELKIAANSEDKKIADFINTPSTYGFQIARYDGDLKGTQVGMTLFYTDLLAKLWALDYQNSTPSTTIPDFYPLTEISTKTSSIYKQESQKLPNTRLWFGHQDKGFQIADDGNSLLFAHNATRVYAKSANALTPKQETTATWASASFLGWWNDRYEEVARYEPQYEKLNQIMKWSFLIGWLNHQNQGHTLEFLHDVNVSHEYRFPSWAKANKQLKFKSWDDRSNCKEFKIDSQFPVCFYEQGYKGTKTEAMPILRSKSFKEFGHSGGYEGGVSLADKQLFVNRNSLPKSHNIIESGLRSRIDYQTGFKSIDKNSFSFKDYEGTTYKIISGNSPKITASSAIRVANDIKLRSPVTEIAPHLEFTTNISRNTDGIKISQTANEIGIGDFTTTKTRNGFKVGFESREMDKVNSLAMDVSTSKKSPEDFFADHPDIQTAYTDEKTGVFYTELKNSDRVLEWIPEAGGGGRGGTTPPGGGGNGISGGGSGGDEPPQWFVRMGFPDDPGRSNGNYSGVWIDRKNFNPSGKRKIVDRNIIKPIAKEIPRKKYSLSEIDKELKKDLKKAALMIEYTIDLAGRKPSLMIRKAVVEIKAGQRSVRGVGFDRNTSTWIETKGDFLKQINGILDRNTKFKLIKKDDAFIYVQDSPGLNNLDWSQPIESSLPRMAPIKIKIYNLEDERIGGTKLSDLGYEPDPALPNAPQNYEVKSGNFSQYSMPRMATSDNCQDPDDSSTNQKPCNHKPVYVVIEASDTSE